MPETLSAARPSSAVGGGGRTNPASATGRITRADGASRVAAFESSMDAIIAANDVASGILAATGAGGPVTPIDPAPAVNSRTTAPRPTFQTSVTDETLPNGRGLLSGSMPILLAETRVEEVGILASDPGLAERTRAAQQYRDVAARIQSVRMAAG